MAPIDPLDCGYEVTRKLYDYMSAQYVAKEDLEHIAFLVPYRKGGTAFDTPLDGETQLARIRNFVRHVCKAYPRLGMLFAHLIEHRINVFGAFEGGVMLRMTFSLAWGYAARGELRAADRLTSKLASYPANTVSDALTSHIERALKGVEPAEDAETFGILTRLLRGLTRAASNDRGPEVDANALARLARAWPSTEDIERDVGDLLETDADAAMQRLDALGPVYQTLPSIVELRGRIEGRRAALERLEGERESWRAAVRAWDAGDYAVAVPELEALVDSPSFGGEASARLERLARARGACARAWAAFGETPTDLRAARRDIQSALEAMGGYPRAVRLGALHDALRAEDEGMPDEALRRFEALVGADDANVDDIGRCASAHADRLTAEMEIERQLASQYITLLTWPQSDPYTTLETAGLMVSPGMTHRAVLDLGFDAQERAVDLAEPVRRSAWHALRDPVQRSMVDLGVWPIADGVRRKMSDLVRAGGLRAPDALDLTRLVESVGPDVPAMLMALEMPELALDSMTCVLAGTHGSEPGSWHLAALVSTAAIDGLSGRRCEAACRMAAGAWAALLASTDYWSGWHAARVKRLGLPQVYGLGDQLRRRLPDAIGQLTSAHVVDGVDFDLAFAAEQWAIGALGEPVSLPDSQPAVGPIMSGLIGADEQLSELIAERSRVELDLRPESGGSGGDVLDGCRLRWAFSSLRYAAMQERRRVDLEVARANLSRPGRLLDEPAYRRLEDPEDVILEDVCTLRCLVNLAIAEETERRDPSDTETVGRLWREALTLSARGRGIAADHIASHMGRRLAHTRFRAAEAKDPSALDDVLRLGRVAWRLATGHEGLRLALADGYAHRGKLLVITGLPGRAVRDYEAALELMPDRSPIRDNYAVARLHDVQSQQQRWGRVRSLEALAEIEAYLHESQRLEPDFKPFDGTFRLLRNVRAEVEGRVPPVLEGDVWGNLQAILEGPTTEGGDGDVSSLVRRVDDALYAGDGATALEVAESAWAVAPDDAAVRRCLLAALTRRGDELARGRHGDERSRVLLGEWSARFADDEAMTEALTEVACRLRIRRLIDESEDIRSSQEVGDAIILPFAAASVGTVMVKLHVRGPTVCLVATVPVLEEQTLDQARLDMLIAMSRVEMFRVASWDDAPLALVGRYPVRFLGPESLWRVAAELSHYADITQQAFERPGAVGEHVARCTELLEVQALGKHRVDFRAFSTCFDRMTREHGRWTWVGGERAIRLSDDATCRVVQTANRLRLALDLGTVSRIPSARISAWAMRFNERLEPVWLTVDDRMRVSLCSEVLAVDADFIDDTLESMRAHQRTLKESLDAL